MILHENKEIVLEDARKGETPTLKNIQKWLKTNGATLSCETGTAITYDDGYQLAFDGTDDSAYRHGFHGTCRRGGTWRSGYRRRVLYGNLYGWPRILRGYADSDCATQWRTALR